MKRIILLILILVGFSGAVALADETPRARIETMVAALQPGNLDQAIDAFAKNSVMRPELVDQMKAQVRAALPGEKKVLGFEFIEEINFGQSVKRLTYVLKTADQPLVFRFTFYKPGGSWLLQKAIVSDE